MQHFIFNKTNKHKAILCIIANKLKNRAKKSTLEKQIIIKL